MEPPHQCFRRRDLSGLHIYNRLIKHLKFLFHDPVFELRTDLHLIHISILHIVFKYRIWFQIFICNIFFRQFCSVDHTCDRHGFILDVIHATGTVNVHLSLLFAITEITELCQIIKIQVFFLNQAGKMIGLDTCHIHRIQF